MSPTQTKAKAKTGSTASDVKQPATELRFPRTIVGSSMVSLHKSEGLLRDAMLEIPGWAEIIGHLVHMEQNEPEPTTVASESEEMQAALVEAIESRQALDLRELAAQVHIGHQSRGVLAETFRQTATRYGLALDDLAHDHEQDLYDYLSAQMTKAIEGGRQIVAQHPRLLSMDADTAADADALEAWRTLREHRAMLEAAHAARGVLSLRMEWSPHTAQITELKWLSNPDEVFEHWTSWRVHYALVLPSDPRTKKALRPPFPDAGMTQGYAAAWFDYFVRTPSAKPWLPSEAQYAEAIDRYRPMLRDYQQRTTVRSTGRTQTPTYSMARE